RAGDGVGVVAGIELVIEKERIAAASADHADGAADVRINVAVADVDDVVAAAAIDCHGDASAQRVEADRVVTAEPFDHQPGDAAFQAGIFAHPIDHHLKPRGIAGHVLHNDV